MSEAIRETAACRPNGALRTIVAEHHGYRERNVAPMRHLAAQFRTEIGLTPKAAARVIRFDRARRLIRTASGADVAAACGYFDQSHLVRDFVAFTGLSPTAWLAAEVGNVQVSAALGAQELAS